MAGEQHHSLESVAENPVLGDLKEAAIGISFEVYPDFRSAQEAASRVQGRFNDILSGLGIIGLRCVLASDRTYVQGISIDTTDTGAPTLDSLLMDGAVMTPGRFTGVGCLVKRDFGADGGPTSMFNLTPCVRVANGSRIEYMGFSGDGESFAPVLDSALVFEEDVKRASRQEALACLESIGVSILRLTEMTDKMQGKEDLEPSLIRELGDLIEKRLGDLKPSDLDAAKEAFAKLIDGTIGVLEYATFFGVETDGGVLSHGPLEAPDDRIKELTFFRSIAFEELPSPSVSFFLSPKTIDASNAEKSHMQQVFNTPCLTFQADIEGKAQVFHVPLASIANMKRR